MGIKLYEKHGQRFYRVSVKVRSKKNPRIAVQKARFGIETEREAALIHRRVLAEANRDLALREVSGDTWDTIIGQWELYMRSRLPTMDYQVTTIVDNCACLRRWTKSWLNRPAGQITHADAEEIMDYLEAEQKSVGFQKKVKATVNVVFDWAVNHRLIPGNLQSPMRGIKFRGGTAENVPDILTLAEIRILLREARAHAHQWYPIWATALLTGMRNGELHALRWSDVDLENRRITVSKSYHTRRKLVKTTKSGQWRTVPISDELMQLLLELKATAGNRAHVLPRFWQWDQGLQAQILRAYCIGVGIKPVRFHALRACFATQLLAHDVAPATVMKVCGWRELKTMQHYLRMAGIDERGATQVLRFLPDAKVMGEVVDIFGFKSKQ